MENAEADNLHCPEMSPLQCLADGESVWRAPAKLNLALRVGRRRADGFHEIDSVAARITLYDELTFGLRDDRQVCLECTGYDCGPVEDNLAYRAARLLTRLAGGAGVHIRLHKRIPPGAGLGGGSSDAAATLVALNRLLDLNLGQAGLPDLAAAFGSDVPLFLAGPAVRIRGRGESVDTIHLHPFFALLYLPELACSTAEVYAAFDAGFGAAAGDRAEVDAARFARPPSQWGDAVVNDLAAAAVAVCPALEEEIERLSGATGRRVHLTGSGSGLFVLADDGPEAERLAAAVPAETVRRCRIVSLNPW